MSRITSPSYSILKPSSKSIFQCFDTTKEACVINHAT